MSVFDKIKYEASDHSVQRFLERFPDFNVQSPETYLQQLASNGEILLEYHDYRYIRCNDVFLPCVKWKARGENVYRIKTVMLWDMVSDRLQSAIDKYLEV